MKNIITTILLSALIGCGGGSSSENENSTPLETKDISTRLDDYAANTTIPSNEDSSQYKVLIFGNSHVIGLASRLDALIQSAHPEKSLVTKYTGSNDYLQERLQHEQSVSLLHTQDWTHVILQAQKYSQSGSFFYPTRGAETWIRMAKSLGITPVLFPEHPQDGRLFEGEFIYNIHVDIANTEPACVSPVGLAWESAIKADNSLAYHAQDGNHAANTGELLTAMVMYQVITGDDASTIPYTDAVNEPEEVFNFLAQIATQTVLDNPPCNF
ncbi:hypothetical protein ACFSJY_07860 [Thalassotalea euphylliae]|uniref:hypothetical protein n=1 Tax=Thalassotalea euphylliae TaxID=1655234 RepID=UPI00362663D8